MRKGLKTTLVSMLKMIENLHGESAREVLAKFLIETKPLELKDALDTLDCYEAYLSKKRGG